MKKTLLTWLLILTSLTTFAADKPISGLTIYNGAPGTNDLIPFVNRADVTQSTNGSTRSMTWSNLTWSLSTSYPAMTLTNIGLTGSNVNVTNIIGYNGSTFYGSGAVVDNWVFYGNNAFTGDTNRFASTVLLTNMNNTVSGNGAGLTNLLAGNIASGTLANARTTATDANTASAIVARDASGNFTAGTITATTFSGSGASLTSLPAGNLTGSIADARLSANVPLLNAANGFTAANTFKNANVSGLGIQYGTTGDTIYLQYADATTPELYSQGSGTSFRLKVKNLIVFPTSGLTEIYSAAISQELRLYNFLTDASNYQRVSQYHDSATAYWLTESAGTGSANISMQFKAKGTGSVRAVSAAAGSVVLISKGAASQTGSLQEWQDSSGTALLKVDANGVIVLPTNTAAPSTITGSGQIYSLQTAGTAEIFVKDGAGNATQISPHARGSLPPEGKSIDDGKHPFPIIVHHQNVYAGEEEWVNLSALAAALEKLTGQKITYRRKLADGLKADWEADQDRQQAAHFAERQRDLEALTRWQADTSDRKGTNVPVVRGPFVRLAKPDHVK